MLSLKVAQLYADAEIRTAALDKQLDALRAKFAGFKLPKLDFNIDTVFANQQLGDIEARLKRIAKAADAKLGGFSGLGGGGSGGGAGSPAAVQAAQQRAVAAQAAVANRAYAQTVAAAQRAATQQIAAQARVQAAHQRSVAAQAAAANRAYAQTVAAAQRASAQQIALGNKFAAAHASAMKKAASQAAAAWAASKKQFAMGAGMGLGLPFATSPAMMGGQALGMGISAIGDGLKASAETAIDLEQKMAEVRRVTGLSADATGRLKQELIDISTVQPGVAIDDLIKMADIGGRMGLKGGELKEFASGLAMVKNSVAGMETEDLANNMSRVLHVFQLGPEYIKGFGSALTAMDNASTASASDILKITQGLSGTAAAIGLTLPQVVALSAALRDAGLSNAVASSSFSQIFRKMATESEKFAHVAGVDAKAFEDAYRRGPMEALAMLMKGLASATDTIEKQDMLKELGLQGVRASGAMLQLEAVFSRVAGMSGEAAGEFTSLNALLAADAIKGDTAAAALGKLDNVLTEMKDDVGQFAVPAIKSLTGDLLELKRAIDTGSDAWAGFRIAGRNAIGMTGNNPHAQAMLEWLFPTPAAAAAAAAPALPGKADPANFTGPTMKELMDVPVEPGRMVGGAPAGTMPGWAGNVKWATAEAAKGHTALDDDFWTTGRGGRAMDLGSSAGRALGGIGVAGMGPGGIGHAGLGLAGIVAGGNPDNDPAGRNAFSLNSALSAGSAGRAMDLGSIAGRAMQGLGQRASAAAGIGGLLGDSLKSMLPRLSDSLKPVARPSASVGLSGADIGHKMQEDILNNVAKDTAKNTAKTYEVLGDILEAINKAKGNATAALLGR